jgi:glycosyltransferase involved in cell wall biosynthesis
LTPLQSHDTQSGGGETPGALDSDPATSIDPNDHRLCVAADCAGKIAPLENTLAYIAPSRIPGKGANSFQVMKMAQALASVAPSTVLIAACEQEITSDEGGLMSFYGVTHLPQMRLLPINGRMGIHFFNLRAVLLARRLGAGLILTRTIGAAAIAARLGVPTVFECHTPPQGFEAQYWRILRGAPAFKRMVAISESLRRFMAARYPETNAMDVIVAHDGVDSARFQGLPDPAIAKRASGRDPLRPIAAYAGHLYAGRGIDVILSCAARLPDWTFVIAGGTREDIETLKAVCVDRKLRNVELLGFVNNAALPQRLAIADVLLMPYQHRVMVSGGRLDTAQWMSPLKMFEYLAMGRPIVASDLAVLREVLDERCAMMVPPADVSAWCAALERLAANSLVRQNLVAAAKTRIARYEWSARVRRMLVGLPVNVLDQP